jgi:hypothetical protein
VGVSVLGFVVLLLVERRGIEFTIEIALAFWGDSIDAVGIGLYETVIS